MMDYDIFINENTLRMGIYEINAFSNDGNSYEGRLLYDENNGIVCEYDNYDKDILDIFVEGCIDIYIFKINEEEAIDMLLYFKKVGER